MFLMSFLWIHLMDNALLYCQGFVQELHIAYIRDKGFYTLQTMTSSRGLHMIVNRHSLRHLERRLLGSLNVYACEGPCSRMRTSLSQLLAVAMS
jgi:hypothetical protein